jgi:hypothetical protein
MQSERVDLNVKVTKVPESAGGSRSTVRNGPANVSISIDRSIALQYSTYDLKKVFWIIMNLWETCDQDVPQHVAHYAAVHGGKRTITPLPNVQSNGRRDKNAASLIL